MARQQARKGITQAGRIGLLEDDMDTLEKTARDMGEDLRAEVNGVKKILVGILISVTTASILLVINIAVIGGK